MNTVSKLLTLSFSSNKITLEISTWIIFLIPLLFLIIWLLKKWLFKRKLTVVEFNFPIGNGGSIKLATSAENIQIAHKIWTELVTRKAAIEINPEEDIITEVYNSWYTLFTQIRNLISNLPAHSLKEEDTRKLIKTAIDILNQGLRPHLTKWQAKYRNWYKQKESELENKTPQELQKEYPEYNTLITEMKEVNKNLIAYAEELKKLK